MLRACRCVGTSIDLRYCLDPRNDVLVALKQNDEPLTADQGYPVRLIVPGMIDGRQVKWLQRIVLSEEESQVRRWPEGSFAKGTSSEPW